MAEKKRIARGRPSTGKAKTPTQRTSQMEAALLESGGRILGRVRLSPEAAKALERLTRNYGTDRASIEAALIAHANTVAISVK